MIAAMLIAPFLAGVIAIFIKRQAICRALLISTALAHAALVALCWRALPPAVLGGWLSLDALGLLFLTIASAIFLVVSFYRVGTVRLGRQKRDFEEGFLFTSTPEGMFCGCMLIFLSTMTLVCTSQQSGLLWIAVEATTLASAPLIYFHRHRRSLEAAWKNLLICSVGIALALLGNFFLAAATFGEGADASLRFADLIGQGRSGLLDTSWLKASFLLMLVGYGTKMGLAPMHTWLPDAYSESPSSVSALLSGALINCSFLAVLRSHEVLFAAGEGEFSGNLLVGFGLFSMIIAGIFILGQRDYRRMLAYSSVEHVGILSFGVGLGGVAVFGAMYHALGHSFTKAMLFLTAGNILSACRTKNTGEVRGLLHSLPATGVLWILGFLAIVGMPPFSTFFSELSIVFWAFLCGRYVVASIFLIAIAFIFIGMVGSFMGMAQGEPSICPMKRGLRERFFEIMPPALLIIVVLALGFGLPCWLAELLGDATRILGGL